MIPYTHTHTSLREKERASECCEREAEWTKQTQTYWRENWAVTEGINENPNGSRANETAEIGVDFPEFGSNEARARNRGSES